MQARRSLPLRWHLVLLVLGVLFPVVVFGALMALRLAGQERAAAERRLTHSARLMAAAVEREIASTIRTLEALSGSERLDRGDLAGFHGEAQRVASTQPSWLTVLLLSADGQQLVNSQRPPGTVLPRAHELASLRQAVETRQPAVGGVARGTFERKWAFPVRVPVVRGGEVRYVLTAVITPAALSNVVTPQLPSNEEWTRTVVDRDGLVVARTREPERFVGQRGSPTFLASIRAADEGVFRNTTLDNVDVHVAFKRCSPSGWTAVISAPVEVIDGPARRSMLAVLVFGLATLALSGTGAFLFSRRVAREIESAADAADALAHGGKPLAEPSIVTEVADLGRALERSAELLSWRERERDEHLARAEASRAEAEAANRSKDEFLAMLGHELRNPLSPIVTAIELLKLRGQAPPRELGVIERQVRHLTRLVDDLLDVSRITRGKVELQEEPVELAAAVARGLEMASPLIEQRRHRLSVEVPTDGLEVQGDPGRLAQVVSNLLTNAAKYTEPGGNIQVLARREGDEAVLAVTDDGQGLSDDLLPHVFDLFVQGPRSIDRRQGGLGIGLTLVRNLVELHGGTVEARSDGPGKGSTFVVRLPLLAERATAEVALLRTSR